MRSLVIIAKADAQTCRALIDYFDERSDSLSETIDRFVRLPMLRLLDTDHSLSNAMLRDP